MSKKFDALFEAIYAGIGGGSVIGPGSKLNNPNEVNFSLKPILKYVVANHIRELQALNNQEASANTNEAYKQFWTKVLGEYAKIGEQAKKLIEDLSKIYGQSLTDVLANYVVSFIPGGDEHKTAYTKQDNEKVTNIVKYEQETQNLTPNEKDSFEVYLRKRQGSVHGTAQPGITSQDKAKKSLESEIERINPSAYRPDRHQGYGK
jgi:hypothetical protein